MSTYSEKLKDPRWQKKRLKILERDDFTCKVCGSIEKTLHVHHIFYLARKNPWEYPDCFLVTACEDCHINIKPDENGERPVDCISEHISIFLDAFWKKQYSSFDLLPLACKL